VASANDTN